MGLRKDPNGVKPAIAQVSPAAAIAGGEFYIEGKGFARKDRPRVTIGEVAAPVIVGSDSFVIVRVPENAAAGDLVVASGDSSSQVWTCDIGIGIADSLHPVANPAVDGYGNIFTTFSGSRGQKVPVAVYKIDLNYNIRPFITDMMNATGLAFDQHGLLYVSSRLGRHRVPGHSYRRTSRSSSRGWGSRPAWPSIMEGNLFVGDRSGTIFKISPTRQIFVFATLEASISAYHLTFGPSGYLYVTGPTTSSFDTVYRISDQGDVETFYRGLGRPQGMAFDDQGRLYVAASLAGRRGVVRITPDQKAELFLSGPGIVGLAFTPSKALAVATTNALYRVDVGIKGRQLYRER